MNISDAYPTLPVAQSVRLKLNLPDDRFDDSGHLIIHNAREARELALLYGKVFSQEEPSAANVFGAGCIFSAWRLMMDMHSTMHSSYEKVMLPALDKAMGKESLNELLEAFAGEYPPKPGNSLSKKVKPEILAKTMFRNWVLCRQALADLAFAPFSRLFHSGDGKAAALWELQWNNILDTDNQLPPWPPEDAPPMISVNNVMASAPTSVKKQLLYIFTRWSPLLGDWSKRILGALDVIEEEIRPRFFGSGETFGPGLEELNGEARFSQDDCWMPRVIMLAKNTLVWMNQLSRAYGRQIYRLNEIPDEQLDVMASRSINALWLIGIWERSPASREIKQRMGNPEAAASAYSLYGYNVAEELGGWDALDNLRKRAAQRGIRLACDMVPNHVGLDSDWVRNHPERLLGMESCPYPGYSFFSDNLSGDGTVDIRLEDHYWDKSDAAVVFQRRDNRTGQTRFIYHGNDGTSMPWNDTAQIDFLNPEAREAVLQDILHVARNFSIIRFDAAMVLALKHIRRLWYPEPGSGGAIPSRSDFSLTDKEFKAAIPMEFWREVVDRIAAEAPGTLLLAEAFWMMEGYFVRTLGMHRVYNSAFMHMLRDQKNSEYRTIIKETLSFDPGILQRFVNFLSNPDEDTAANQFGLDDRYFAACTLLITLPGLPMIGHGQIEGLTEKYGMEYRRAYQDEQPDSRFIERHSREIFPLLARRHLFSGASRFRLYDLHTEFGTAESVYVFSNCYNDEHSLVVVNNAWERSDGTINTAAPVNTGDSGMINDTLGSALIQPDALDEDWLLLREHIAGLWYIRSAGAIRYEGMHISVDGFGRQVYMDIHTVKETPEGLWARLAAELNSAGVADIDAAFKELRLRPIKNALNILLNSEILSRLADEVQTGKPPSWPYDIPAAEQALTELGIASDRIPHTVETVQKRLVASSRLWRFFRRGFRRLIRRKFPYTAHSDSGDARLLAAWSILSVPCAGRWDDWNIGSWLAESGAGLESMLNEMEAALDSPVWNGPPASALPTLLSRDKVRGFCGVNMWEGQLWYNRESWNSFARTILLRAAGEGRSLWSLWRLARKWARADRKAGYQLSRLLRLMH